MTTFIQPTAQDTALRDQIEEISMLETMRATQCVVAHIDEFRARMAAGETPEQIAIDYHLTSVIGVPRDIQAALLAHLKATSPDLREALIQLRWQDVEAFMAAN